MAEEIIRKWRLAVLRVELDLSSRDPRVVTTMVGYPVGIPTTLWSESFPAQEFGIPVHGPPKHLKLPDRLPWHVAASLREDLPDETALWLRLVPPYGYLGAAPWEEVLVEHIDRPVLRVPDRFPVAADFGDAWTAAIAVHAGPDNNWAATYIRDLTNALRDHVGGALALHVFADPDTRAALLDLGGPTEPWLHLHDPSAASEALASRKAARASWQTRVRTPPSRRLRRLGEPGRTGSPPAWLVVQCARCTWSPTRHSTATSPCSWLALTPTGRPHLKDCPLVAVDGLLRLTASLGAATLSIGSPPARQPLRRRVAHDRRPHRAGAGRSHDLLLDHSRPPRRRDRVDAFLHLADRSGRRDLPWHPSLFAYLQPENVRDSLLEGWPETSERSTSSGEEVLPSIELPTEYRPATAESTYDRVEDVPTWVAASHAYLGSEYAKLARSADPVAKSVVRNAYDRGAAKALDELRAIIDRHSGL